MLLDIARINGLEDTFVDSFPQLGLTFTELQVMKLAGISRMQPRTRYNSFGPLSEPFPAFQPMMGEFGRVTYHNGNLKGWESLGTSRHWKDMVSRREVYQLVSNACSGSRSLILGCVSPTYMRVFGTRWRPLDYVCCYNLLCCIDD